MQAVITLSEALELMRSGEPFDLVWITADRQRGRGGEILTAKGARLPTARRTAKRTGGPGPTENGGSRQGRPVAESSACRNPNHYAHGTRNIRLSTGGPAPGKIRKVHIQLIDSINGQKVV